MENSIGLKRVLSYDVASGADMNIMQLFGHCIATWSAMSLSLVNLTEIKASCERPKAD